MAELLRVSGKDLGVLELTDHCPRCFWVQRRAPAGLPFQIFPGIFSSIDSFTRKVVHQWFDAYGAPKWLGGLGPLVGYEKPPHFSTFQVRDPKSGVLLTGSPDAIFRKADGSIVIGDYKTAKYTDAQDALLPMYRVQLNAYAYIAEKLGYRIDSIALIYAEPITSEEYAHPDLSGHEDGFRMRFQAIVKPLKLETEIVEPLLLRFRILVERETAHVGRKGCKDCQKLDGLNQLLNSSSKPER